MPDPYGLGRVVEPPAGMPQPAWRIDNTPTCRNDEVLIDVDTLNVDAASFAQIKGDVGADPVRVGERLAEIVRERGKLHNPVTGSGGMLIGRVAEIGPESSVRSELRVGDRVATLVSLTLTPLWLEEVKDVDIHSGQVAVVGKAILFDSGVCVRMPDDLPDRVALAVFDVCGAPAQAARMAKPGQTVAVLGGGGKSGALICAQARRNIGASGRLFAIEYDEKSAKGIRELGCADDVLIANAQDPVSTWATFTDRTGGVLADLTFNCVSAPGTELTSILVTRERGLVYFFGMATRFTAAALGAEGVGKDVDLMIGNGYAKGHAELALNLVRSDPALLNFFAGKVGHRSNANDLEEETE